MQHLKLLVDDLVALTKDGLPVRSDPIGLVRGDYVHLPVPVGADSARSHLIESGDAIPGDDDPATVVMGEDRLFDVPSNLHTDGIGRYDHVISVARLCN